MATHVTVVRAPDGVSFMVVPLAFPEQQAFDAADPAAVTPEHVDLARRRAWALWDKGARYRTYPDLVAALDAAQGVNEAGGGESIFDSYLARSQQARVPGESPQASGFEGAPWPEALVPGAPTHEEMQRRELTPPMRQMPPMRPMSPGEQRGIQWPGPAAAAPPTLAMPGRMPAPQLQTSAGRSLSPELVEAVTGASAQAAPSPFGLRLARRAREPGRLASTLTQPF